MIKVRLFAALRELAGASEVEAEGRTAGEVADALSSTPTPTWPPTR